MIIARRKDRGGLSRRARCTAIILTLFIFSTTVFAGPVCTLGPGGYSYDPKYDSHATGTARDHMKRVYKALCPGGCGHIDIVQNPTAAVAMAWVGDSSTIVYDARAMNTLLFSREYGLFATYGILAHEIGHHIAHHQKGLGPGWEAELTADYWAGCALAQLGVGTISYIRALQYLSPFDTATHPGWQKRAAAVDIGFRSCR